MRRTGCLVKWIKTINGTMVDWMFIKIVLNVNLFTIYILFLIFKEIRFIQKLTKFSIFLVIYAK